jgi:hypothetical protein
MSRITIRIVTLLFLLPTASFAAPQNPPKSEASVPYYNGGYSFGLAGYHCLPPAPKGSKNLSSNKGLATIYKI